LAEEIWVNVARATQITGYNLDHVRRLARENWRLPENQRRIRVRKDDHAYEIWLPDLIDYIERRTPAFIPAIDLSWVEKIWVNTSEGAEITGYSRGYLSTLASQIWNKPEDEREIRIKKRLGGHYELWLPDLIAHTYKYGHGPQKSENKPLDKSHDSGYSDT
jgi:hypothetical protein